MQLYLIKELLHNMFGDSFETCNEYLLVFSSSNYHKSAQLLYIVLFVNFNELVLPREDVSLLGLIFVELC